MAYFNTTIELKIGPGMRTALDVLDLAKNLLDLIPEWHQQDRVELESRADALIDACHSHLQQASRP